MDVLLGRKGNRVVWVSCTHGTYDVFKLLWVQVLNQLYQTALQPSNRKSVYNVQDPDRLVVTSLGL